MAPVSTTGRRLDGERRGARDARRDRSRARHRRGGRDARCAACGRVLCPAGSEGAGQAPRLRARECAVCGHAHTRGARGSARRVQRRCDRIGSRRFPRGRFRMARDHRRRRRPAGSRGVCHLHLRVDRRTEGHHRLVSVAHHVHAGQTAVLPRSRRRLSALAVVRVRQLGGDPVLDAADQRHSADRQRRNAHRSRRARSSHRRSRDAHPLCAFVVPAAGERAVAARSSSADDRDFRRRHAQQRRRGHASGASARCRAVQRIRTNGVHRLEHGDALWRPVDVVVARPPDLEQPALSPRFESDARAGGCDRRALLQRQRDRARVCGAAGPDRRAVRGQSLRAGGHASLSYR